MAETCEAEDKPRTIAALIDEMLLAIARDLIPERPARSEPRNEIRPLSHRKNGVEKHPNPR